MGLSEAFLAAAGAAATTLRDVKDLEARLAAHVAAGAAAWPGVELPADTFVRHLAAHVRDDDDPCTALDAAHAADLYLACACARGDRTALDAFDRVHLGPVVAQVAGKAPPQAVDELRQALRTRLLVSDGARPARIAGYSGVGPLAGWVRTAANRVRTDLRRDRDADEPLDDPARLRGIGPDPEVDYLRARYGPELKQAFADAVRGLPARDVTLLRLHFLDGLPVERIAPLYDVSRSTAYRQVTGAKQRLLAETRRLLADRLNITAGQLDTMIRLAQSQIDIDLGDLLKR